MSNRNYLQVEAIIKENESLSSILDLGGPNGAAMPVKALVIPANWTSANITFQASDDYDGTFFDVYDASGSEYSVTAAASRFIVDLGKIAPLRFVKLRSGTTNSPVVQTGGVKVVKVILTD